MERLKRKILIPSEKREQRGDETRTLARGGQKRQEACYVHAYARELHMQKDRQRQMVHEATAQEFSDG
jgi:hypothetical protein